MSRDGCVALTRGAMGLFAVCDCQYIHITIYVCDYYFPDHTHLLFLVFVEYMKVLAEQCAARILSCTA